MTVLELVQAALQKNAEAFGNIHESRSEKIVLSVLAELVEQIKSVQEGEIEVDSLGKFIVRPVKANKDDNGTFQRRILFRVGSLGKKTAGKNKGKNKNKIKNKG